MPVPTRDGGRSRDGGRCPGECGGRVVVGTDHDASWFFSRSAVESQLFFETARHCTKTHQIRFAKKTFVTRRCRARGAGQSAHPDARWTSRSVRFRRARLCFARITALQRRVREPSRSPPRSAFLVTPARSSETFVASAKRHDRVSRHVPRVARAADAPGAVPHRAGAEGRQHDADGVPEIHRQEDPGREVRARRPTAPEKTHWISARDDEGASHDSHSTPTPRSNSPFPDAHSAVSAQVPEPDGFEHVPRVEVREREEGREKIQPRVRPRASEPSASVRRPSSPRVSRRTEKKKLTPLRFPSVSVSTRRCMPSQLEGNFRRAAAPSGPGASRFAAPPSRFGAQR